MKVTIALLFAFALMAQAQSTKVTTAQIAPKPATLTNAVQVFVPTVGFTLAVLDPAGSVVIDTSQNPPVIKAVVPVIQLPAWVYNETITLAAKPSASLTLINVLVSGTQLVYRNGVKQSPGVDYNVSGNTITFLPASAPTEGDVINIDYRTK